jgi:hypothetical protein
MGNDGVTEVEVASLGSSGWSIKSSHIKPVRRLSQPGFDKSSRLCSKANYGTQEMDSPEMRERFTYTTIKTATKIDAHPAQVAHPRLWKVRMLATEAVTTVARKDHQTVQAAWVDSVLMPMDTPRIPDPETSTKLRTPTCQT